VGAELAPLLEITMRAAGKVLDEAPPLSWGVVDLAMLKPDANNEHLGVILKAYHRRRIALAYLLSRHTHIRAFQDPPARQDFPGGVGKKHEHCDQDYLKILYQIAVTFPSLKHHHTLTTPSQGVKTGFIQRRTCLPDFYAGRS
jgi:hypothetical protein